MDSLLQLITARDENHPEEVLQDRAPGEVHGQGSCCPQGVGASSTDVRPNARSVASQGCPAQPQPPDLVRGSH